MTPTATTNWHEANQSYLMTRLSIVRDALTYHVGRERKTTEGSRWECSAKLAQTLDLATRELPGPAALDNLCSAFGLSPFERDVLLMCAGMELDSGFAGLCADAQGDSTRPYPTFSLALAALSEPHWSAITPAAPLRRWRFVEVGVGDALTSSQLRIDERALHYLTGVSCLDGRLHGLIESLRPPTDIPRSHRDLTHQIAGIWSQSREAPNWPIINLCGSDPAAKQTVAAYTCRGLNIQLCLLRAADIPPAAAEREALSRLWEREAALSGNALLVDCEEAENSRVLLSFLENVRGMLFVASREPLRLWRCQIIRFDVDKPSAVEQQRLWQEALGPLGSHLDGQLELLVSQFSLGAQAINSASAVVRSTLNNADPEVLGSTIAHAELKSGNENSLMETRDEPSALPRPESSIFDPLWDACRVQARSRLDDLAQRIEPVAAWDDLVLPDSQRQTLRDIAAHVRQRAKVYESWGFAAKGGRGLGLSALFAGASGTGKTMAAEVLAYELRLDLYRIDLSQVVSKYIGETEKNLRRVFDSAEEGGAILLFDEADALFGKRTEVRDSHDRYANIEVSYLLTRMESYRGLAILTTNMKSVLDAAFMRRIRFIVQFPFPDSAQRAEIWRRIFPRDTPRENLDVSKLARLNIPGGNIRNIALHAAFLAADADEPVRMFHLLRAARTEYAKLEKPLTDAETARWL